MLDDISRRIWTTVFGEIDPTDLISKHGPGSTADKISNNKRYRIRKWNDRSELMFPSDLHCFFNYEQALWASQENLTGEMTFLSVLEEIPVRVVFVPKTQSSPRVIAIEPAHMQYVQQSVKDYIYRRLEEHPLTKNSLRFTDQNPNKILACLGSIDNGLATIDLKDASDRVHFELVRRIFRGSGILDYLEDARSLHAELPDGTSRILNKYASQGSALCFPVEAMVFYTLIQSAMHTFDSVTPCSRSIKHYSRLISVFGDDIIVPTRYTEAIS